MSRKVHVSRFAGDDSNDGLSPHAPKCSIAAGVELLRHGFPDELLLRRGDVWEEGLGHWKKSGRSASQPMIVASYGNAPERPLLLTPGSGIYTNGGGGSPASIDHLALVGLHMRPDGYRGIGERVGMDFTQPSRNLLLEDVLVEAYSTNIVLNATRDRHRGVQIRRTIVLDAFRVHEENSGHPQGLYAWGVDGLLIEGSLFDHNGWNERVPGAGADVFSHNVYIDNSNSRVRLHGNVLARASSHGLQLRCGGEILSNLFLGNSIGLSVGGGDDPHPKGVHADVRWNVILEGKDIDEHTPRGWGMHFSNIVGGRVASNVIAHCRGKQPSLIAVDTEPAFGVHKLGIQGNTFFDWGSNEIEVQGDRFSELVTRNNEDAPTWDGRTLPDDFLERARRQRAGAWDTALSAPGATRYLRSGFS